MSDLRQRRHAETKQALFDAAFALLRKHGFDGVTMDQIAVHAGVSRSTAYRRYTSKEDIILDVPRQFVAAWDIAIASSQAPSSSSPSAPPPLLSDLMTVGCLGVATWIDANSDNVLLAYKALAAAPTLQASDTSDWVQRMIDLILDQRPEVSHFEAAAISGAYMGALDTMMMLWVESEGTTSVRTTTQQVLELLDPVLPK